MSPLGRRSVGMFMTLCLCACDSNSTNGGGPNAASSPTATPDIPGFTNADPGANCNRRTENFRYTDGITGNRLPWIKYSPGPNIFFFLSAPPNPTASSTPIAIEIPVPKAAPKGAKVYKAAVRVPVLDFYLVYGPQDRATVMLLPSGQLSQDYQTDLQYRHELALGAQQSVNRMYAATTPIPLPAATPSPNPQTSWDQHYQQVEAPAVTAISRGMSPDDSYIKNNYPWMMSGIHPRLVTCFWLERRPYDMYVSLLKKVKLSGDRLAQVQHQLSSRNASASEIEAASWIPYERDEFVAANLPPEPWFPDWVLEQDPTDRIVSFVKPLNLGVLFTEPIPQPDDTAAP
ncbi:MAG: hypothetical protein M3N13_10985 [Candidatus Eremiobacteraeota bacterium]|nr:hypothetical protein [Candidatus Eremiobacteraeota bacterium]